MKSTREFNWLLLPLMVLLLGLACSDNDSGTPADEGNFDDPAFLIVDDVLGTSAHNMNLMMAAFMSDMVDSVAANIATKAIPFVGPKAALDVNPVEMSYVLENNWYIFTDSIKATATESDDPDSVIYFGTDSLQFLISGTPSAPPDLESVNAVTLHNSGTFYVYFDDGSQFSVDYSSDFTFTAESFGADTATINGAASYDGTGTFDPEEGTSCTLDMTMTITYTNLDLDWVDEPIPFDGNSSANATFSLNCESSGDYTEPNIDGVWTATWALNNGSVTATYHHGSDTWVYTDSVE